MTAKRVQLCVSGTYPYFHLYFLGTQVLPDASGLYAGLEACCGEEVTPPERRDVLKGAGTVLVPFSSLLIFIPQMTENQGDGRKSRHFSYIYFVKR